MKRFILPLFVALCVLQPIAAQEVDVNFALTSNGSTATASSGNATAAIDGNNGSRWESAFEDPQWWLLDMAQERTFNTIQIIWEGAYGKTFTISTSNNGTDFTPIVTIQGQSLSGFPNTQTFEFTETKARYIKFDGTERGTQYGYSFFEFKVFKAGASVLQSLKVTPSNNVCKVGEFVDLAIVSPDQNGKQMEVTPTYTITPQGAGEVKDGKYYAKQKGKATIAAKVGEVAAPEMIIFGYEGENLALNKLYASSGQEGNNAPENAVDGNAGTLWNAHANTSTAAEERTYDAWLVLDLGNVYDIDLVSIQFEGACSELYHLDFSKDNETWTTVYNYVGNSNIWAHTDFWYDQPEKTKMVRYIRFFSTKASTQYGMKVYEMQVFGSQVPDNEKPTIQSAEFVEASFDKVKVRINATDNLMVSKCQVADATNNINGIFPLDGNIATITGLKPETTYNFAIKAVDGGGNISDQSVNVTATTTKFYATPQTAAPTPTVDAKLVHAIYSDAYTVSPSWSYKEGWGDATIYEAKQIEGDNYAYYTSFNWLGWAAAQPVFLQHMEYMHIDIWAANDGKVKLTPIYGGAGLQTDDGKGVFVELKAQQWNHFDIPLTDFKGLDFTSIFQMKYSDGTPELTTFAIDNLYFYRTTAIEDTIAPTALVATMDKADYFSITLNCTANDESGVVFFNVYNADTLVLSAPSISGKQTTIRVDGLQPSQQMQLSITASDLANNATEPLIVEVATLQGPKAAPLPLHGQDSVISIYSDAYPTNTYFWIGGWAQATVATTGYLAPNDQCYLLTNTDYLGWEINDNKPYNVARTNYMHVDVYCAEETTLDITPISLATPTNKEGLYKMNLKAGQWNQFDIPLTAFPTVEYSKFIQIKFFNGNGKQFFIDNVYFWGNRTTGLEDIHSEQINNKIIRDGQLIIIRNGVKYDIFGRIIQ